MTAITTTRARVGAEPSAPRRIWNVVRLHYANAFNTIALPWIILGFIFLVNFAIWLIIAVSAGPGQLGGTKWTGSVFYIYVYLGIVAMMCMNQTFQFALGFSVTRRDYYLGTSLMFVIHSAVFAAALTTLSYLEEATGGWWLGGHMFAATYFTSGGPAVRFFGTMAALLVCMFLGSTAGSAFVRWRAIGLMAVGAITVLLLLALAAVVGLTGNWGALFHWIAAAGVPGVSAVMLVPAAIGGIAGFFILRGATPKS